MKKKPIIIDCDTGTDDAIAIIAALYSPELDVRAFTTVAGNAPLEHTSRNTLNLVRYLGFDIKVAIGASAPFIRKTHLMPEDDTHGDTGLGTIVLPETKESFYKKTAVETIYEEALNFGGSLELIPIGPLTNIALAIKAYPDLKKLIKQIVFMGGAKYGGNVTSNAEFNIWADPEAAKIVFASSIPLTMIGLDVTLKAILGEEDEISIRNVGTKASTVTADLLKFMFNRRGKGGEDAIMHDALAVAVCVNSSLVKMNKYFVDCECNGCYTSGHTFVALTNIHKGIPNCNVAEELDILGFKAWIHQAIINSTNK